MNRFWVAPLRFGSVLAALICLQSSAGVAQPEDDAWLKRSREILKDISGLSAPEWLRQNSTQEALAQAEQIARQSGANDSGSVQPVTGTAGRVLIFGSFSIPDATLRALLLQASESNVVFVLRGIPAGETVRTVLKRLKKMLPGRQQVPNVILDPTLFRRYKVQAVPTLVLERGGALEPVRVSGAVTVAWLRRMSANVQKGTEQLGRRAETYEIAETDFIADLQRRVLAIDWDARRRAAIDGYWRRPRPFVDLPEARQARTFLVDPSVRVTEDLLDASGGVLIRAGEKLNPLEWATLTKTVIVFRGTDQRHVAKAMAVAKATRAQGRGVILLTTRIDTERGWKHLDELERALSASVYVLPQSLVERFHLAHVPATVAVEGRRLLVHEIPVEGAP